MMNIYCAPSLGQKGSPVVYALLEHAYRIEYGESPPEIKKTPNGKPFFPERPDVFFSLSHAKTHVACVLSDVPVGVDIESPREVSNRAVRFFCSEEELTLFEPLELWVLKESFIKLIGGTVASVKYLRFSRSNNEIITPEKNVFSGLYYIEGCTAAVSVLGGTPPGSVELYCGSSDFLI